MPSEAKTSEPLTKQLRSLDSILELEPLIDHPDFFNKLHPLSDDDLKDYPKLQARYKQLKSNVEAKIRDRALTTQDAAEIIWSETVNLLNPFRIAKVGAILNFVDRVVGPFADLVSRNEVLTCIVDMDLSTVMPADAVGKSSEDKIEDLYKAAQTKTQELAKKKTGEPVTQDEAKFIYALGKIVRQIIAARPESE